jgi:hypothetical protein
MQLQLLSENVLEPEHAALVKAAIEYAGPNGIVAYSSGRIPSPHTTIHFKIGSVAQDFAKQHGGRIGPSWLGHRGATTYAEIPHKRSGGIK